MTAPNPGPMTAEGTNAYLIGRERVAVVDPGPDDAAWRGRLLAEIGDAARVAVILITHSHLDHSAGAHALAAETGAPMAAFGPHGAGQSEIMAAFAEREGATIGGGEGADRRFAPDQLLEDGAEIASDSGAAPEWRAQALHTPGHLGNHLCFGVATAAGGRVLLSGDLVMGWATSLVSPPDGDMAAFMASLARLEARQASDAADPVYLPGHGAEIADPSARLAELVAHRRGREAQILAALADGPGTAEELAARIYNDIDQRLLPLASRNVLSHLLDLNAREIAIVSGRISSRARFQLS